MWNPINVANLLNAAAAFLAGLASIITAIISVKISRKSMRAECNERIRELREEFDRGLAMADERHRRKRRIE